MAQLLTLRLHNISEHEQLCGNRDAKLARSAMLNELYRLIDANSLFIDKLDFPNSESFRLKTNNHENGNRLLILDAMEPKELTMNSFEFYYMIYGELNWLHFYSHGSHSYCLIEILMALELQKQELIFMILQFLKENKYKETVHKLEKESAVFFNMPHFEEMMYMGQFDEAQHYLLAFTNLKANRYSKKIFFEIRKQKYFEALDKHDNGKALEILMKDLSVFASDHESLFKEMKQLLAIKDFREMALLSTYKDTQTARKLLIVELKKLLRANPLIREKLSFPDLEPSRLQKLLKKRQSDNTQLQTPVIDKMMPTAKESEQVIFMVANMPLEGMQMPAQTSLKRKQPLECATMAVRTPLSMPNQHSAGTGAAMNPSSSNPAASSSCRWNSHPLLRTRSNKQISNPSLGGSKSSLNLTNDLPKIVGCMLDLRSPPTSMDFHPSEHTLLIVGTSTGKIEMWDVRSQENMFSRMFSIWNNKEGGSQEKMSSRNFSFLNREEGQCSKSEGKVRIGSPSVNRVLWSPDGSLFGAAYSERIVQLFCYCGRNSICDLMELEAHAGSVNDLAFACSNDRRFIITCGHDATIKVWHLVSGAILYTFQGHKSPICCVVSSESHNLQNIWSVSVDGKIKQWTYGKCRAIAEYDAPGFCLTTMSFSADGARLISCGTTQDGVSYLDEWCEKRSIRKRTFQGVGKCSFGVMQFDMAKNGLLVAGDDFSLKFWDLNAVNLNLAKPIDANETLPASRLVRLNKEGTLLAVNSGDNKIKILVSVNGLPLLEINERVPPVPDIIPKGGDKRVLRAKEKRPLEEAQNGRMVGRFTELNEPSQFRLLRLLPYSLITSKILKLAYLHSGSGILALSEDAIHLCWRWSCKATTSVHPRLARNKFGEAMTNDLTRMRDEAPACFAVTPSDGYLLSSSGGGISLFNLKTLENVITFMHPPPAATNIAVYPWDNNIIAVGMNDSTIHIYNVQKKEIIKKFTGHSKRITGLAFSNVLNVLVSSAADAQLVVWKATSGEWERQRSRYLWIPNEKRRAKTMDVRVQFSQEQTSFLAVCQAKLAVYNTMTLNCVREWNVNKTSSSISDATFSCDGRLVYASFMNGTVCIFMAEDLQIRCRISPGAYLPPGERSKIYPVVVAANPEKPNQFGVGLSVGGVIVFEPLETEEQWGLPRSH